PARGRVVAPGRDDLGRVAGDVDGAPGDLDARSRLERQVRDDVLARGDAAEDSARVVAQESARRQLVAMLAAALCGGPDAGAELHRLHGVDAHERGRDV